MRDYLPGFKLYDPVATDRITPRDLVTHRSGLPRHDLMWYNSTFTRQEMIERLRYLEPSRDFKMAQRGRASMATSSLPRAWPGA